MSQSLPAPTSFADLSRAAADLVARAVPSIVQVHGRPRRPASGVVIAPERVVTTSHSVEWTDGVTVRTDDGQLRPAEVAGHAPGSDVVLLRVPGLAAPALAFSATAPRIGELVVIAGRTWRATPHARLLAVSGIGGPLTAGDGTTVEQVVGLPVSPYPGVSGSAVLGADGHLAALATAGIVRGRVLGLPAAALQTLVEALETRGTVSRGYLGVTTQPVHLTGTQAAAAGQDHGLVVLAIADGSPAASTLLVGDVLLGTASGAIGSPEDLLAALSPDTVGTSLALRVLRGGTPAEIAVTVGARPSRW